MRIVSPLRWVAAAAPKYLNRRAPITKPENLKDHNCIQIRTGEGVIYRWEFEKNGERLSVEVPGQLCVNETMFGVEMATSGAGITYCLEQRIEDQLARGELQVVLSDWAPVEPAFYIYYPGHRQTPTGLRELIDMLREQPPT